MNTLQVSLKEYIEYVFLNEYFFLERFFPTEINAEVDFFYMASERCLVNLTRHGLNIFCTTIPTDEFIAWCES